MKALLDGLKALGPARLGAMGAVALGMLGMLAFLALHGSGQQHMALLYGDLDLREAAQIADQLDKAHIPHSLGGEQDRILVPANQVANARLLLAKSGLPSGGSIGYEIFDRGNSLTTTQFEQNINETRALEGELVRSITLVRGIHSARVHLVLPHREPFASEAQPAQASVLLAMNGAARLDPEGVQAIVNLVAAAVPGLKPQNIAIIDNRGDVLARAGTPTGMMGQMQSTDELRQATELRLSRAVEEMLEPSLGHDHVRAEAAVTMNVDQVHETQESYDPNQQVLRSQQTSSDKNRNTEAPQTTSVANNLPNANAGQAQAGSQQDREQETNNYEIGRTVRTLVQDQPRLARLSLAVMVDGVAERDAQGRVVWKPRSQEELDRIATLVKSAIGYDAKRGDTVSVVSMRFNATELDLAPAPVTPGFLGLHLADADLMRLGQSGMLGLFVLLALLLVVRPTILRLAAPAAIDGREALPGTALATAGLAAGTALVRGDAGAAGVGASSLPALAQAGEAALAAETAREDEGEDMVNIARVDGQLRASSLRQIGDLVRKHPDESLSIVRGWLGHEAG